MCICILYLLECIFGCVICIQYRSCKTINFATFPTLWTRYVQAISCIACVWRGLGLDHIARVSKHVWGEVVLLYSLYRFLIATGDAIFHIGTRSYMDRQTSLSKNDLKIRWMKRKYIRFLYGKIFIKVEQYRADDWWK